MTSRRRASRPAARGLHPSVTLWRYALTALLGLSGRRAPRPSEDRRQRAAMSSVEAPAEAANPLQFGRAYQLPPFGHGNALDALFWTRTAVLPPDRVAQVLTALHAADIAGWVAPSPADRSAGPTAQPRPHDLWVASDRLDAAQDLLMALLRT